MDTPVKPNYVIRKSAWSVIRPWHILLFFLIVPLLIMIWTIINIKDETISFYNNKVVIKSGILRKNERTTILTPVLSVTVKQTFWGRIFNYGNIHVDMVGKWDINMRGVKNPMEVKAFLENFVANGRTVKPFVMN
ncbi:MAG: PH domain-containing protein [Clostridia bacterium]|nr:PH domain-containing protein [Clostridia bacterium]